MTRPDPPRRESAFALVRRLVGGGVALVRLELQRGRQEIGEMVAETKVGAILLGIAAALALLVLISLDVTIILGVAALFEVIADLAVAIIIGAVFLLVLIALAIAGAANAVAVILILVAATAFVVPALLGFRADWLAALFVLVVQAAAAGALALRGVQKVRIGPPQETIESVKEDFAWAKRLLKRE
jgi:hypothetical protein